MAMAFLCLKVKRGENCAKRKGISDYILLSSHQNTYNCMRKSFISFVFLLSILTGFAQSFDERIGGTMNRSDWFALDSIYREVPKDSISPFLEVFSRCLIGNRLNRTDVSIPAFEELLTTHSESLDAGNLHSSAWMYAMDLSRVGENGKAADVLLAVLDATRPYLDSTSIESLQHFAGQYRALSAYRPYSISFEGDGEAGGVVPFRIVPVGKEGKGSVLMHLENSTINGIPAEITFDTGAGVNVMADSLAEKYDLIPLDAEGSMMGYGKTGSRYALVKVLKIGNITVRDVPFHIIHLTTNNAEADKYVSAFSIVVGSELMLHLKDVTLDFANKQITVPREAPTRMQVSPNLCFSGGMNLLAKGVIHGNPMLMRIDSGDAGFGSLNDRFFKRNEDFITSVAHLDTIRGAGVGGVSTSHYYNVPNMMLQLGGNEISVPELGVLIDNQMTGMDSDNGPECNLGLRSLMLFDKVRFNLVDFVLTTSEKRPIRKS